MMYVTEEFEKSNTTACAVSVKVIPTLDIIMRGTKESILNGGWRSYTLQAVSNRYSIQAALQQHQHIIGHAQSFQKRVEPP
jgi:hypothetical protein